LKLQTHIGIHPPGFIDFHSAIKHKSQNAPEELSNPPGTQFVFLLQL
jgi:hypothetical protein